MQKLWKSGIFWHDLNPKVFMLEILLKWKVRLLHLHSYFIGERVVVNFQAKQEPFQREEEIAMNLACAQTPLLHVTQPIMCSYYLNWLITALGDKNCLDKLTDCKWLYKLESTHCVGTC